MIINYDDQLNEVVDKVNEALEEKGFEFSYNEEESGDGFVMYDLVEKNK